MNLTAIDLKTKASHWAVVVLLFISLFTIAGGLGRSPMTSQKITTSKLAGSANVVHRTQLFYKSFIQKIRAVNFQHIFLSSSNSLLLLIKGRLVQIQTLTNSIAVLLIINLSIGYFFVRMALSYPQEQAGSSCLA